MTYDESDLRAVQREFGFLSPNPVEKDWHVVQALAAIARIETGLLQLVFAGGTCLARAHKLVRRMSEDVDLKIVAPTKPSRASLRRLREAVAQALLEAGFKFDPANRDHMRAGNESRYAVFHLPYSSILEPGAQMRPVIQIEMGVWPLRQPAVELSVGSFIAEAYKRPNEVPRIACVSVTQTAAEKFVALTRRVAAEIGHPPEERDPTLVRHIYDLHAIRAHYHPAEVAALARETMPFDAEEFGNKEPAYRADPMKETQRAIEALTSDTAYARIYEEFCRVMVYGHKITYDASLATLSELAKAL